VASPQQALAWFDAEYHVLLAAVTLAAEAGFDVYAWQLPWAMARFLDVRGSWHQWAAVERSAVDAATRLGDTLAQATSQRMLAAACARLGDYEQAEALLAQCLVLSQQTADVNGQCRVYQCLSWIAGTLRDHYADGLRHAEHALALCRDSGNPQTRGEYLNAVGWNYAMLGRCQEALTFCGEALDLHRELGDRTGQAYTLDSLGYAHHHLGQYTQAADCYTGALSLMREVGDFFNEAEILTRLGDTYHAAGDTGRARRHWQQALTIHSDLNHPNARRIQVKLADSGDGDQRETAAPTSASPACPRPAV
jgi:tetratricopeptide (TPR) repeat protein